jgi:signal transduction histidine kinase
MASLFVVRGRDQGKHFKLTERLYRIGRESSNDIQLLDSEASRSHAEIRVAEEGQCDLVDLSSSNGTLVNGNRITRHALCSGDRIEIGNTLLIYTGGGNAPLIIPPHSVDIVANQALEASRIVSSISPTNAAGEPSDVGRSLEVMYRTAIAVGRGADLNEVLDRVLRLVFDWVEADRGCIMLREGETNQLRPAARCDRAESRQNARRSDDRMMISRTILEYVMSKKEGVRTSDARDDARFDSSASIVQGGVREALCVPLQGRYDIVGTLYVDTYTTPGEMMAGKVQHFTDDHLRLITAIGHQAALAIEDTFYYSALLQSERLAAMGQTIATVSHHIKNILQGIRGGSYLIEAGLAREDTEAIRRGWGIVERNQERISNLVLDMLTFSKEREPQLVEADLNETVRDVIELMQARASEFGVQLGSAFDPQLPVAMFDPDAIHRAVMNLVTNAIDAAAEGEPESEDDEEFSPAMQPSEAAPEAAEIGADHVVAEIGKVFVRTSFDEVDGWRIDVVDNGPGIRPEDREKIFSLFESRKGARGTGLGLPVSAKIMKEHGGRIEIIDPPTSHGCMFRLVLPPHQVDFDLANHQTFV